MRLLARLSMVAVMVGLAACGRLLPEEVSGEQVVLVLAYDPSQNGGEYKLVKGKIKTLKYLRTLQGDAAGLKGGAHVVVDTAALAQLAAPTAASITEATTRSEGGSVDFAYFMADGVIHPEGFDSLAMATLYYNLERAHLYFDGLSNPLYNLAVEYGATYETGSGADLKPVTDNIIWEPISRRMIVAPTSEVEGLPLEMNVGVVAHEYTHAVFTTRFYSSEPVPWLLRKSWAEPPKFARAMHLATSFDEGLADTFGALISGDPAFMRKSLPAINEARRVDAAKPRCITAAMQDALDATTGPYDPYPLGSVLSAALWESVAAAGDRRSAFARGLVDGMAELGAVFKAHDQAGDVTLADAVEAVAKTINADLKPRACGILLDRFGLDAAQVPSCAENRAPDRKCP